MKDINTYIKEGFYKNVGIENYTKFLVSFETIKTMLLATLNTPEEDLLDFRKTSSRWNKFSNLVATLPKNYGFAITVHDSHSKFKYSFNAYVNKNGGGNQVVFGYLDKDKPFFGPKGEIKVDIPFSNWMYTYINCDLLELYERIMRGYIDKIYDIYPIKYTPDGEKSFEVIQY